MPPNSHHFPLCGPSSPKGTQHIPVTKRKRISGCCHEKCFCNCLHCKQIFFPSVATNIRKRHSALSQEVETPRDLLEPLGATGSTSSFLGLPPRVLGSAMPRPSPTLLPLSFGGLMGRIQPLPHPPNLPSSPTSLVQPTPSTASTEPSLQPSAVSTGGLG